MAQPTDTMAIAPVLTFEDRIKQRIKDSIGDLMTDEDLQKILARGVEETFFKPTYTKDQWGGLKIQNEPLITGIIKDQMSIKVKEEIEKWFAGNPELVKILLDKVIREGIIRVVLNGLDNKIQGPLMAFSSQVNAMMTELQKRP